MTNKIEQAIDTSFTLEPTGSWPKAQHLLDEKQAYAILAAQTANRPLLLLGEPGVGKSQLARVAAYLQDKEFMSFVVQPNSDYEDILWSFDHTARLSDAQLNNAERVKNDENYIAPGPLWYALDWVSAKNQAKKCNNSFQPSSEIAESNIKKKGIVLLIDEIDKADISLSNGLLEALGNRGFFVPPLGKPVTQQQDIMVVLTSNNTRQLPEALQRRCVVLDIKLPKGDALIAHLVAVGKAQFETVDEKVLTEAAKQIIEDRVTCKGIQKTGQAEYLDLIRALIECSKSPKEQIKWLKKLSQYFKKSQL